MIWYIVILIIVEIKRRQSIVIALLCASWPSFVFLGVFFISSLVGVTLFDDENFDVSYLFSEQSKLFVLEGKK